MTIMASEKKDAWKDSKNDYKIVESDREGDILKALEDPKVQQTDEIAENADISKATFYNYRPSLLKKRLIISGKNGKKVLYALAKNRAELNNYMSARTALEDHVIRQAHRLIDEIATMDPLNKAEFNRIDFHCIVLQDQVESLRRFHSELPDWKWLMDRLNHLPKGFQGTDVTDSHPGVPPIGLPTTHDLNVIILWNRHWVKVLELLEGTNEH